MKVLFVNPIVYTPENAIIPKVDTIYNTMSYDLCVAFLRSGIDITLAAAEEWKPLLKSDYPFNIVWMKSYLKSFFPIHRIPVNLGLIKYLRTHDFDMIITSEVFSIDSLLCALFEPRKTVIWHEMAQQNNMGGGMLSRIWYNTFARLFMHNIPIVARSNKARQFIDHYCNHVLETVVDHGVDLHMFSVAENKTNSFCVVSQLIPRKCIDGILRSFAKYHATYDNCCELYIIGDGVERHNLERLATDLGIDNFVVFTGQLDHQDFSQCLAEAKALLINTEKDNSMISVVESIASGTPVLTTSIPLNSTYIREYRLGIVKDNWGADTMHLIDENLNEYVTNCLNYRNKMSTNYKVQQFLDIYKNEVKD